MKNKKYKKTNIINKFICGYCLLWILPLIYILTSIVYNNCCGCGILLCAGKTVAFVFLNEHSCS